VKESIRKPIIEGETAERTQQKKREKEKADQEEEERVDASDEGDAIYSRRVAELSKCVSVFYACACA